MNVRFAYGVPTRSWYSGVIKEGISSIVREHEERYLELDESHQSDNLGVRVDLRNDYAFKQLFGRIGNERILIEFLNVILKLPIEK